MQLISGAAVETAAVVWMLRTLFFFAPLLSPLFFCVQIGTESPACLRLKNLPQRSGNQSEKCVKTTN